MAGEGDIDVVMNQNDEPDVCGRIKDSVERRIEQTGDVAGNLARDKFFVDREFADAGEDAWKCAQNSSNMVGRIHIGRVKPRDHRVETRLFLARKPKIRHRNVRVREGVVIKRRVRLQIVRRRIVSTDAMRPLLLKRYTEQSRPAGRGPHDFQELPDRCPFLYVVIQVKVHIVELGPAFNRGNVLREERRY